MLFAYKLTWFFFLKFCTTKWESFQLLRCCRHECQYFCLHKHFLLFFCSHLWWFISESSLWLRWFLSLPTRSADLWDPAGWLEEMTFWRWCTCTWCDTDLQCRGDRRQCLEVTKLRANERLWGSSLIPRLFSECANQMCTHEFLCFMVIHVRRNGRLSSQGPPKWIYKRNIQSVLLHVFGSFLTNSWKTN